MNQSNFLLAISFACCVVVVSLVALVVLVYFVVVSKKNFEINFSTKLRSIIDSMKNFNKGFWIKRNKHAKSIGETSRKKNNLIPIDENDDHKQAREEVPNIIDADSELNSGTPSDITISDHRISLLRDQVDALQVEVTQQKRPWYQEPSLIISIFALVISILFSSIGLFQTSANDKEEKQELLRQTIVELTDTQSEIAQIARDFNNDSLAYRNASGNLNTKRQVLIDRGVVLIDQLGNDVDSSSVLSIAGQLITDGRFAEAKILLIKTLNMVTSPLTKSSVLRMLGQIHLQPGSTVYDPSKGREYLQQSIDLFKDQNDETNKFYLVDNLLSWALLEIVYGDQQMATDLLEQAKKAAETLSNPNRQVLLTQIQQAKNLQANTSPSYIDIKGEWRLSFENNSKKNGKMFVIYAQSTGSYFVNIVIYENGKLVESRLGNISMLDAEKIIIQWQGSQYNEQTQAILPSSGVSFLSILPDSIQLKGLDSTVGCKEEMIVMTRP